MSSRFASHAGSWYVGCAKDLDDQLGGWLADAQKVGHQTRAVISPHAGYSYCGASAAHAYKQIEHENIKRIFILGPSHHVYLPGCALSSLQKYETPLYSLKIDQGIYAELKQTNKFTSMTKSVDEDEHSIEMQLPYIAKIMEKRKDSFTIVPVLVGGLDKEAEKMYGKIFSSYLGDPQNLFVISSDFCHWGRRFKYTYFDETHGEIYKSIEHLDRMGMKCIEDLDATKFHQYLRRYANTICGRHPIGVLLNAVEALQKQSDSNFTFKFLDYRQSSKCRHERDSSVSYAAGILEPA